MNESQNQTLAARKLPLVTLTLTSCNRLLSPCLRILHMEGPTESLAAIIDIIPPAAHIAAFRDSSSVILYLPTYLGLLPVNAVTWSMMSFCK